MPTIVAAGDRLDWGEDDLIDFLGQYGPAVGLMYAVYLGLSQGQMKDRVDFFPGPYLYGRWVPVVRVGQQQRHYPDDVVEAVAEGVGMTTNDLLGLLLGCLGMDPQAVKELGDVLEEHGLCRDPLIKAHNERVQLRNIRELFYPGGDPDHEWDWEEVQYAAEYLDRAGLGPDTCGLCGHWAGEHHPEGCDGEGCTCPGLERKR